MNKNYPKEFGFLLDPSEMIGKTIEDIDIMRMEFGCTYDNCILIRFTDGSRGFLLGRDGNVIVGPDIRAYESRFFTPEEYGAVQADIKRKREQDERDARRRKEEQLKKLQEELGK